MQNKLPRMKLSRDEDAFLARWMYDETHFEAGPGQAKQLQRAHGIAPADLANLIAAAMPDSAEQRAAAEKVDPAEEVVWPWPGEAIGVRLEEARAILMNRHQAMTNAIR